MFKRIFPIILLMVFVQACQDGEIGTQPATVPGLFVTWQLISETVTCPGEDPVVTEPEDEVLLTLRRDTYTIKRAGEIIYDGSANFDGETIFFTPSPFPNNFLGEVKWVFNGRSLVLNSTESKDQGDLANCSVKRSYDF